jgi:hypothetical protein
VERTFTFTPESLTEQIKETVTPFVEHMRSGTFHVRIERRGLAGKIATQEIERAEVRPRLTTRTRLYPFHGIALLRNPGPNPCTMALQR